MDPSRLKVSELKIELKKRGLTLAGSKTDLVARLRNRIQAEASGHVHVSDGKIQNQKQESAAGTGGIVAAATSDDKKKNTRVASKSTTLSKLAQTIKRCRNPDDDEVMLCKSEEIDSDAMLHLVEKQTKETTVYSGVVKSFSFKTGYGFIVPDGTREDLFVHQSQISSDVTKSQRRGLLPGTEVEFMMSKNEWGKFIAIQVTKLGGKAFLHPRQKKIVKKDDKNSVEEEKRRKSGDRGRIIQEQSQSYVGNFELVPAESL